MLAPVPKPRIAVLGLALEFYERVKPDSTAGFQAQLERFQQELATIAEIGVSRLCLREAEVAGTLALAESRGLDACLVIPLCYTASLMSVRALVRSPLPLVVWNTQEAETFTDDFDFGVLWNNHVMQGAQDVTHVLIRAGRRFGLVSGHYREAAGRRQLEAWLLAARAARAAPRLRIGRLGSSFQDMGDFGVDTTRLGLEWGPHAVALAPARLVEALAAVSPQAVAAAMDEDRRRFEIAPGLTEAIHRDSVALELALRRIADDERLDGLTMNFLDLIGDGRLPTLPFLGINKLMGEGLGYAGEGDVLTAALMAQARWLGATPTFTEMYTADYTGNRILMTHMQECNPALARRDRRPRLVPKPFWAPGIRPYAGLWFTLEPGPVTLVAMAAVPGGGFAFLTYETRILDHPPFERFDIPHWLIQPDEPVGAFLTRYGNAGGPHHLAALPGRWTAALGHLAAFLGFPCTAL